MRLLFAVVLCALPGEGSAGQIRTGWASIIHEALPAAAQSPAVAGVVARLSGLDPQLKAAQGHFGSVARSLRQGQRLQAFAALPLETRRDLVEKAIREAFRQANRRAYQIIAAHRDGSYAAAGEKELRGVSRDARRLIRWDSHFLFEEETLGLLREAHAAVLERQAELRLRRAREEALALGGVASEGGEEEFPVGESPAFRPAGKPAEGRDWAGELGDAAMAMLVAGHGDKAREILGGRHPLQVRSEGLPYQSLDLRIEGLLGMVNRIILRSPGPSRLRFALRYLNRLKELLSWAAQRDGVRPLLAHQRLVEMSVNAQLKNLLSCAGDPGIPADESARLKAASEEMLRELESFGYYEPVISDSYQSWDTSYWDSMFEALRRAGLSEGDPPLREMSSAMSRLDYAVETYGEAQGGSSSERLALSARWERAFETVHLASYRHAGPGRARLRGRLKSLDLEGLLRDFIAWRERSTGEDQGRVRDLAAARGLLAGLSGLSRGSRP